MYNITLNEKATRTLDITEENLQTIRKYRLFQGIVDSTGYITEEVLDKMKMTLRSMIAHSEEDTTDLLNLCIDVIYHDKMKAYGLKNLMAVYRQWEAEQPAPEAAAEV